MVIVGRPSSPLVRRLREESEALGFTVDSKDEESTPLADELTTPDVVAAIRVLEQPDQAVELAIMDPKLHQLIHEQLALRASSDPTAMELVATRAIELLRAIRLRVPRAPGPRLQTPPTARAETPVEQAPKPTTALSLSPLGNFTPHLSPGLSAEVQANFIPRYVGVSGGV
ncbi:MAG TPA: hypothetical protein VGM44_02050, partial [Polyangiaceae bacterium]